MGHLYHVFNRYPWAEVVDAFVVQGQEGTVCVLHLVNNGEEREDEREI